jgi:hypothetical protein
MSGGWAVAEITAWCVSCNSRCLHFDSGRCVTCGTVSASVAGMTQPKAPSVEDSTVPGASAPAQRQTGWFGRVFVPCILVMALINMCDDGDGTQPSAKYTPEECVALQLSAINGDGDASAAAEWDTYCD